MGKNSSVDVWMPVKFQQKIFKLIGADIEVIGYPAQIFLISPSLPFPARLLNDATQHLLPIPLLLQLKAAQRLPSHYRRQSNHM